MLTGRSIKIVADGKLGVICDIACTDYFAEQKYFRINTKEL